MNMEKSLAKILTLDFDGNNVLFFSKFIQVSIICGGTCLSWAPCIAILNM